MSRHVPAGLGSTRRLSKQSDHKPNAAYRAAGPPGSANQNNNVSAYAEQRQLQGSYIPSTQSPLGPQSQRTSSDSYGSQSRGKLRRHQNPGKMSSSNGGDGGNQSQGGSGGGGFHPFNGRVSKRLGDNLRAAARGSGGAAPYLSYHDILLTKEDVDTLRGADWLTDSVIAFWEEYLEREYLARQPDAHVVLLRPSMTFLLMNTRDSEVASLSSALPQFKGVSHVFCPINDCHNVDQAEGGSHWSLLLVSIIDRIAFHYDSLSSANVNEAGTVARKLGRLIGTRLEFRELEDAPQQENGSDCGVFVCGTMEHVLLKRLLVSRRGEMTSMSLNGSEFNASAMRRRMHKTIEGFRKEGERRRSRSSSPLPSKLRTLSSSSRSPPRIGDD